ncbi:MAG: response regulator [Nitrososphaeraceae archaeon]|nr:response regulator [Nitrososphaeraceae archaeon]
MGKTVLIIEEDEILLEIYKEILELHDYDVQIASNGTKGIEKFKQTKPELVIMEIEMPDIDGLEVFKKIKEIDKNANIIIVTSDLEFKTKNQKTLEQEPIKVILKPILVQELLNIAKRYIGSKLEKINSIEEEMDELVHKTDEFIKKLNEKLIR